MVCARRLHNWGASVRVILATPPERLGDVPRHQLTALERMGVPVVTAIEDAGLPPADLIVDALIGYSLRGAPEGVTANLILAANGHSAPILALDVPSGVDTTTGTAYQPAIMATATLTLALPKEGLRSALAREHVGELYLGDISVPPELYGRPPLSLKVGPVFATDDIIRIW